MGKSLMLSFLTEDRRWVLKPALVLEESCSFEPHLTLSLVGKLKEFDSLPNLKKILVEEGFTDIIIRYMEGFRVLFQSVSKVLKDNFMAHVGVNSWFSKLHQTSNSFYVAEKVAWIEIEGWAPNFIDDYSDSDEESVDSKFDNFQKEKSEDPFNIYAMLNKKKPENSAAQQSEGDLQYPPGFTPRDISKVNSHLDQVDEFADNGVDSKISHKENVNTLGCSETKMETIEAFSLKRCGVILHLILFIVLRGVWVPNGKNLLIISVYAPQELSEKKMLWDYLALVIASWKGEVVMIGNFNEVRKKEERFGSNFNVQGADAFNSFIPKAGLEEVEAFDKFVKETWNEVPVYKSNDMINLIKKLKYLKENIRVSNKDKQMNSKLGKTTFKEELAELDTVINKGEGDIVNEVQPAFIADRQILDGLFILTGLVQWCKSKKKQLLIFKVDFGKAYDSVCWDYLDDILKKFGFGERCFCGAME
nr:RNA-directed DNA polymerase, eukaryota [Tanacetum cinerariifolium]